MIFDIAHAHCKFALIRTSFSVLWSSLESETYLPRISHFYFLITLRDILQILKPRLAPQSHWSPCQCNTFTYLKFRTKYKSRVIQHVSALAKNKLTFARSLRHREQPTGIATFDPNIMIPSLRPTLFRILTLTVISNLLLTPAFVSGALFPKNSLVKTIDAKEFRQVMKLNVCRLFFLPRQIQWEPLCF